MLRSDDERSGQEPESREVRERHLIGHAHLVRLAASESAGILRDRQPSRVEAQPGSHLLGRGKRGVVSCGRIRSLGGCAGSFPDNTSFQISGSGLQTAASLDFDAAVHKIGTAGVLADPTLILEAWDVNRQGVGQRRIGIDQEIKLWGKYGLERSIAQSDADAAKFQGRAIVIDLIAQVVAAHGEYNAAYEATGISVEIKRRYDEILGLLRSRYGTTSGCFDAPWPHRRSGPS